MTDQYKLSNKLYFLIGSSPIVLLKNIVGLPRFVSDYRQYRRLNTRNSFDASLRNLFPILTDREDSAGTATGHYFHQDLWAARKIFRAAPQQHIDVGSRIDGFVAHLLVFMPVTIIDIRALRSSVRGLTFTRDDATQLNSLSANSVESISSLHAAEHFGLGRYSDPIDPSACFQFMSAVQRVLAVNGSLYFSVPVGRERLEFNAHRVFAPQTILDAFSDLKLISFSFVDDNGSLREDTEVSAASQCDYACGLYHFTKPDRGSTDESADLQ